MPPSDCQCERWQCFFIVIVFLILKNHNFILLHHTASDDALSFPGYQLCQAKQTECHFQCDVRSALTGNWTCISCFKSGHPATRPLHHSYMLMYSSVYVCALFATFIVLSSDSDIWKMKNKNFQYGTSSKLDPCNT